MSRLKDEEDNLGVLTRLTRPRALILLPSRDLAAQVLHVAKSLCHQAKFRAVGLIGGMKRVRIWHIWLGLKFAYIFLFLTVTHSACFALARCFTEGLAVFWYILECGLLMDCTEWLLQNI